VQIIQGSRTADEYVLDFKTKRQETGYNDEALKEKFEKGLNPALLKKIYALPVMPTNLQEWMNWVMKLDRQWRELRRERIRDRRRRAGFAPKQTTMLDASKMTIADATTITSIKGTTEMGTGAKTADTQDTTCPAGNRNTTGSMRRRMHSRTKT
jgi:hypothetical protein